MKNIERDEQFREFQEIYNKIKNKKGKPYEVRMTAEQANWINMMLMPRGHQLQPPKTKKNKKYSDKQVFKR